MEFKIGSFAVRYDGANKRIKLSGGCAEDSLILYQCACGIFIGNGTELKPNTLIVQNTGSAPFKNEGIFEAFITYFEDCKSVENKGNFTSRNLFLIRTDIQNYGMISWCDAYHNIDGNVKNLVGDNGKNGFIKMGKKTGNTWVLREMETKDFQFSSCSGVKVIHPLFCFGNTNMITRQRNKYHPPKKGCYAAISSQNAYCFKGVHNRIDCREKVNSILISAHSQISTFKDVILITKFDDIEECSCVIRQNETGCFVPLWAPVDSHPALYFIYDNPNDHQTAQ